MLKRISITLVLTVALLLVFAVAAYANYGPHGGYVDDTDSCAGCHRAHTSFSTVGWTDRGGNEHETALLVGSATTMTEFCNSCHGDFAPGASTNVVSGIFDAGPTGATGIGVGSLSGSTGDIPVNPFGTYDPDGSYNVVVNYTSASTFGAGLNGGGFVRMPDPYVGGANLTAIFKTSTSAHTMDAVGPLWGAGNAVSETMNFDCGDCHDPHGTSNYRLLKATVNGVTVGGYLADGETPNPWVSSYEAGYPLPGTDPGNPGGGWLKHEAGAAQMAAYQPDYTAGTKLLHTDATGEKTLSAWCSACHTRYNIRSDRGASLTKYSYSTPGAIANFEPRSGVATVGPQYRHRHPVDVNLAAGFGPARALQEQVKYDAMIPLEENNVGPYGATEFEKDWIGCLTCHRAHGSSADMTGWAAAHLELNTNQPGNSLDAAGIWMPVQDAIAGVDPDKDDDNTGTVDGSSALLRTNQRGVCERCHNK